MKFFDDFNNLFNEFFNHPIFKNIKKTKDDVKRKRGRKKTIFTEKDCEVSYHPEILCQMYYPGEYVDFEEVN